MPKRRALIFLSITFFVIAVVSLTLFCLEVSKRNRNLFLPAIELGGSQILSEVVPDRIKISKISLDLPVTVAKLVNSQWEYSDTSVLFVEGSGSLGTSGNKILYGHNYPILLKNLKHLKVGDLVTLHSKETIYTYSISSISTITPDQTHILSQTSDDRITLFTCTGFLDSKRLVVVAERIQE